ncbi:MAG: type II toxin-antitoxin system RelE/ParE family toxin [Candidatus Desulfofervidaceae bacterium]|nr:type II toxin-antitoxin system RelE/ParE family toxin [Candidatus Desulfofervidaceae bacterium]
MYKIEWKQSATKELKNLKKSDIPRIIEAVEKLSVNPSPPGTRKLQGCEQLYRIRVGEYRVVYSIKNKVLLIEIIRVGHRKNIYKNII